MADKIVVGLFILVLLVFAVICANAWILHPPVQ